jgi:hypothetical protein
VQQALAPLRLVGMLPGCKFYDATTAALQSTTNCTFGTTTNKGSMAYNYFNIFMSTVSAMHVSMGWGFHGCS